MNILMVAQVLFPDTIGGAGRYLHDAAMGLKALGHRVVIFAPQVDGCPPAETREGVEIIRCGPLQAWWQAPGTLLAIRRRFHELHAQTPFDIIAIHQPFPALVLLGSSKARRVPWVYHFHSPWAHESRLKYTRGLGVPGARIKAALRYWVEQAVIGRARRVITLSRWMQQLVVKIHQLPAASVEVISGCVDLERFHPASSRQQVRQQLAVPADKRLLLTVRNLVPRMNLEALIRAVKIVAQSRPDVLLAIAGDGPLKKQLQDEITAHHLTGHVRLLGAVTDEALPRWYQGADLFVMPSKALEGFGLATLEALACGTPAVGTPIGGTKELLSQIDDGLLSAGTDCDAIAALLLGTLNRLDKPEAFQGLSRRCEAFAAHFSLPVMAQHLEQSYKRAQRIKVLHVHTLPVISGSGLNTFLSMRGQKEAGYEVALACAPQGPLLALVEQNRMQVHRLRHMVWAINPVQDLLAVLELRALIKAQGYAVVHTHNSKAGFLGRLAGRLAEAPVIVHTIHGFAFHDQEPAWKRFLYKTVERWAAGWCDKLIVISQPLIEWALKEHIAPAGQMVKIYSGIDLKAFRNPADTGALRASLGLTKQDLVVGEVAKLWEGKGHDVLLKAVASIAQRAPSLRVVLVGEGGLRPRLEALADSLGIRNRVVFTGFHGDVAAITQVMDIAVLPSLFEGMGRAVIEAQAAGKPVIGSRVGGIPDLIRQNVTGLLVEPGDVSGLASAIIQLCENPALRKQLGEAGSQSVDARFDARTMNQQILKVYDELLAVKVRR